MNNEIQKIEISDMLEKTSLSDSDLLIVEDEQNTKKMTIINFIRSIIKDNEVPTEYRLYSSYKLQSMINDLEESISEGVGNVRDRMDKLESLATTKQELKDLQSELIKSIDSKVSNDLFITSLSGKRDKNTKITSYDLDISSDDNKIQLFNLSKEVIDYMLGATPVPTNRAPIGGWVTEDIADNAIVFNKLSEFYRYSGNIKNGNVDDLVEDGLYLLGSDVVGLPKQDSDDDNTRILDVSRVGEKHIIQTIYYCDDVEERPIYRRKGNVDRIHVLDFVKIMEVTDTFKIGRDMLKDDFSNNGIVTSGSIYTIREEGHYYAKSTVTELPTVDDYLVEISKHNDRYIYTAHKLNSSTCDVYESLLYFTAGMMPVTTNWYMISNSKKSKFDSKRVYLFGDGILFGLGSDDIPNKSIPALLSKEYGLKINNRAIGDATIGNYDDENLAERSIIKQIETTPLDNADYVIIFAGTKDWEIGKAEIGTNNVDINDIYFKGSINKCISDIANKNPEAKVVFCTPIFRSRIKYGDNKNSDTNTVNDKYLSEYVDAIIEVCNYNHIPVIDLYHNGSINKFNSSSYLKDGLYPNDKGNALLASKIIGGMEFYF